MIRFFFLLLVGTLLLFATEPQPDLQTTLKQAKREHKQVFMMYTAPWCPECNYMKEVVFTRDDVKNYLQKHFVMIDFNVDKDPLPKGFTHIGIPTYFIISPEGQKIAQIDGGSKAEIFLKKLKALP